MIFLFMTPVGMIDPQSFGFNKSMKLNKSADIYTHLHIANTDIHMFL